MGQQYGTQYVPFNKRGKAEVACLDAAWAQMAAIAQAGYKEGDRGAVFYDSVADATYWIPIGELHKTLVDSSLSLEMEAPLKDQMETYNPHTNFMLVICQSSEENDKLIVFSDASLDGAGWRDFRNDEGQGLIYQ